jgi:hypothetical protein
MLREGAGGVNGWGRDEVTKCMRNEGEGAARHGIRGTEGWREMLGVEWPFHLNLNGWGGRMGDRSAGLGLSTQTGKRGEEQEKRSP